MQRGRANLVPFIQTNFKFRFIHKISKFFDLANCLQLISGFIMKTTHDAASSSSSSSFSSPTIILEEKRTSTSPTKSVLRSLSCKLSSRTKANKLSLSSSKNYSNELQKVFDYFDEDGNGKISPSELQSCVRTVGGELSMDEAEAAVRASDLNGDGLLDFEEFQKLMDGGGEEDKNEELKEAFGMYEMEGSGCITPTSLKRMLSRLGESKSIEDCKAMIRMFDLNGDGVLSFDEFQSMMR